jgi:hypothetical protein
MAAETGGRMMCCPGDGMDTTAHAAGRISDGCA